MSSDRVKVLLVDDEASLRQPFTRYLSDQFGFEVDSAADYGEAMECVTSRQGQYDVALIDRLLIPPPDGIQLMRDIKSSYPDIECIIATGWGTEERQLALREGAFRYIEKPFNYEELETLIHIAAQQVRLRAISRDVISRLDLESVLQRITAAVRSLARADDAEIQLLIPSTGALRSYGRLHSLSGDMPTASASNPLQLLTQHIISSGKAEIIPDLKTRPDLTGLVEQGLQSLICIPIPDQQDNLGVLLAYGRRIRQFDKGSDIGLLQTLAGQAGLAIANARAFEETQRHACFMEALVYTTGRLTQTTAIEEQLQLAWDFIREQLQTQVFLVAFRDREQGLLTFPIVMDKGERITLTPKDLEEAAITTISGHVVKSGAEFFTATAEDRRQRCASLRIQSTTVGDPCESCLCLPLIAGGEILGAMSAQAYEPHAFSPALLGACRALANHLAIAIANSQLVDNIRRRANDLKALLNLSLDIASSLDLQQVMDRVCHAAADFFQAEHSGLVLFESALDCGYVVAEYPSTSQALNLCIPLRGVPDEENLLRQREPLVIPDVATRHTLGPVQDILLNQLHIQSTIIVPVIVKDRLLGSFSIDAVGHARQFTAQDVELAQAFAAQVAMAIDHAHLFDAAQSRARLLATLDESARHIRAEKDPERLMHEIVRLAAELIGCQAGSLLKVIHHPGELEITVVHQLPPTLQYQRVSHDQGSLGLAARTGESRVYVDYRHSPAVDPIFNAMDFHFAVVTPLRIGDQVAAVLFLADPRPDYQLTPAAKDALERFVNQAAIALTTSQFLTAEQRAMAQQRILVKVSDYIQATDDLDKILHVVLTGVTAGYGLGFNRAALWLLDEKGEQLIGCLGIGHFDEGKVRKDWQEDQKTGRDTFSCYIDRLSRSKIQETPVGAAIRGLQLPLTQGGLFTRVVASRRYQMVHENDIRDLPQRFIEAFEPAFPFIVAPLIARGRTIGLLVADNKFTHAPITDELLQSLLTYTSTAAIAIENRQLYDESRSKLAQVERTRTAARVIAQAVVQQDLRQTLTEISHHTRFIINADTVTIYALAGASEQFVDYGFSIDKQRSLQSITPPERLLKPTSSPYRLLSLNQPPYYQIAENGICDHGLLCGGFTKAENIHAAVGIQLRASDRKMGVMYVNFRGPHHFSEEEISTIQLFADQAAAAIRNKQLYDEADRRAVAFHALYDAGQTISASQTLHEMLAQIATQALMIVGAESGDGCTCEIVLKSGSRLHFAATSPLELLTQLQTELIAQLGIPIPVVSLLPGNKTGVVGRVALTGKPALLGNAPADPDYIGLDPKARSELAVPMKLGDQIIGVINLEDPQEDAFHEEDLRSLELLAAQAAVAVHTARLNEQTQLVADISREANSLELAPFLNSLFERLTALFKERHIAVYLNLGIFNATKDVLRLIPTDFYPAELGVDAQTLDERGIMVYVARNKEPYYAPDVTNDPNYRCLLDATRSELATPVFYGDELLGVLDLESPVPDAFSPEDREFLGILAHQIASILHNLQQYEELRRAQGLVGTRTTLAWMGMVSGVYRHEMSSNTQIIHERLEALRKALGADLSQQLARHLESIERVIDRIKAIPLAPPLSAAEGVECFPLFELLNQRLEQLRSRERFSDVEFTIHWEDLQTGIVRASPEWIKRLIDLLCYNAVDAMDDVPVKRLAVRGYQEGDKVHVAVQDSAKGIPESVRGLLFKHPVPREFGARGLGVGLLMAQLIVETYSGGIDVDETGNHGTTMRFWLPAEKLTA